MTAILDSGNAARNEGSGRLLFIDGLRGVAALAVVFFHYSGELTTPLQATFLSMPGALRWVVSHGCYGVEIFFVLSGFVIARSVRRNWVTPGFLGNFALRRSIRLDPPYWFIIGVVLAMKWAVTRANPDAGWFRGKGYTVRDVLANMAYLHLLLDIKPILSVAWTLCLEVQFYLAYILLLGAAQWLGRVAGRNRNDAADPRPRGWALAAVHVPLALATLWTWYLRPAGPPENFIGLWHMFLLGAVLQWSLDGWVSVRWFGALVVAVLALSAYAAAFRQGADAKGLTAAAAAVSIWAAARWNRWDRWLAGRAMQFAGRVSYSLYLVHIPVGTVVLTVAAKAMGPKMLTAIVAFPATVAAALLAAYVMHRAIEQPSVELSKRLKRRRRPAPAVAPAAENGTLLISAAENETSLISGLSLD